MSLENIEQTVQQLVDHLDENNQTNFIFDFLLAYNQPKASIARLKKGDYNRSKSDGQLLWRNKLCFQHETEDDLHHCIDQLKSDPAVTKLRPRFIIVTDFQRLLSVDTKTDDSIDIPFEKLAQQFDFFLPWAGMEKAQLQSENPADVKAAAKMGQLYDLILHNNPPTTDADRHTLNLFLSRLLFCFFAEDTEIFKDGQFSNAVGSHTAEDGSDLQPYLQKLFAMLNVKEQTEERHNAPQFLQDFPYVNGGLFAAESPVPAFCFKSRKTLLECGSLNWKAINPDIFGSMMQAVVHSDQRGKMGMHYTSVVNIMKVIEPLFLNQLKAELHAAGNNKKKLEQLRDRLYNIHIFDPACGSGNFLIIAYKELCTIETEIFRRLQTDKSGQFQKAFRWESNLQLTQFYGIELDDFAHETAKLSLWLTEHQMNMRFKEVFGSSRATLPLQEGGHITCGNANRLNWEEVCPKELGKEIYVLGNPPYVGSRWQSKEQKDEMAKVFQGNKNHKSLDYIASWFLKGAEYIAGSIYRLAFVSTNSICQGEQVALLWPTLFSNDVEIGFAHHSFKWTNNAQGNAGVTCIVVGLRTPSDRPKELYIDGACQNADNINPYLANAENVFIKKQSQPLANFPQMRFGNMPNDGGFLILSEQEKNKLLTDYPHAKPFIKKLIGSSEFIRGQVRYCLWITDDQLPEAIVIPFIAERIEKVKKYRLASRRVATQKKAVISHHFSHIVHRPGNALIIPRVSSERRPYIPIGFLENDTIISDLAFAIYDPPTWIFAVVSSRMHMVWVRTVAGRLKTDYRYSSSLCYNTFPFPKITQSQQTMLEDHAFAVLDAREEHPEKSMADLYDPNKIPYSLKFAHQKMDTAIEQCYRDKPFQNDNERLEYLFKRYKKMTANEKK